MKGRNKMNRTLTLNGTEYEIPDNVEVFEMDYTPMYFAWAIQENTKPLQYKNVKRAAKFYTKEIIKHCIKDTLEESGDLPLFTTSEKDEIYNKVLKYIDNVNHNICLPSTHTEVVALIDAKLKSRNTRNGLAFDSALIRFVSNKFSAER